MTNELAAHARPVRRRPGGAALGRAEAFPFAPGRGTAAAEIAQAYAAVTSLPSARSRSRRAGTCGPRRSAALTTPAAILMARQANFTARAAGVAAGLDYKLSPDTLIGFALAGGGTSWGLAQGLAAVSPTSFRQDFTARRNRSVVRLRCAVFANYWASTMHDHAADRRYAQRWLHRTKLGRPRRGRLSDRVVSDQSCALRRAAGADLLDPELFGNGDLGCSSSR